MKSLFQIYLISSFIIFGLSVFYPLREAVKKIEINRFFYKCKSGTKLWTFRFYSVTSLVNWSLSTFPTTSYLWPTLGWWDRDIPSEESWLTINKDRLNVHHLRSVHWEVHCSGASLCKIQVILIVLKKSSLNFGERKKSLDFSNPAGGWGVLHGQVWEIPNIFFLLWWLFIIFYVRSQTLVEAWLFHPARGCLLYSLQYSKILWTERWAERLVGSFSSNIW